MSFPRTVRSLVLGLAAALALVLGVAPTASADAATTSGATSHITGVVWHGCSAAWLDNDRRLGPAVISNTGVTGRELRGYRRTGRLSTATFLATYWDPAANGGSGGWIYPPDNGYVLDDHGAPMVWSMTLGVGRIVDRYGSEYGTFLGPAFTPYADRAIPPSNLVGTPPEGCNYYSYRVLRPLPVHAGPIAAWFAQPGGGLQYQLDGTLISGAPASINIMWLLDQGYLERYAPRG